MQEFQVLRVLEPALRMKAQTDSNSRGRKDFIRGEFICRKEKRKIAYWRMQADPKPVIPWFRVGSGFYSLFLYCLRVEMPFRCKQAAFPGEKCLLDLQGLSFTMKNVERTLTL
jgi:hypothetical protein